MEAAAEILLVEDSPHDVELVLRALRRCNLTDKVRVTRDGVEALDFLFGADGVLCHNPPRWPKVVFLDLKLPRIAGLEVLRKMKMDERSRHIPVVVLTSSREERDVQESYALGVNSYVVKPVDYESFAQVVSDLGNYWVQVNVPPT